MAYTPYATVADFQILFPDATAPDAAALRTASRHVDTLTFNRIVAAGFDNLTSFQQEIIKEVVCRQTKFETDYADVIGNVLSSYSINGVSMSFPDAGSWNVYAAQGVAMQRDVYALLEQTGLCCRVLA